MHARGKVGKEAVRKWAAEEVSPTAKEFLFFFSFGTVQLVFFFFLASRSSVFELIEPQVSGVSVGWFICSCSQWVKLVVVGNSGSKGYKPFNELKWRAFQLSSFLGGSASAFWTWHAGSCCFSRRNGRGSCLIWTMRWCNSESYLLQSARVASSMSPNIASEICEPSLEQL